ncbi:unnamed protein product [Larinioides sclopetarius]|uniref:Uncharacterized protein n=1 Tax=Larinioides sclopetarius TaxID=280406 RepID=A0AAV2ADU4_9ARAC
MQTNSNGKLKDPWILGMTRSTLVIVNRGPKDDLSLQYHLLPLEGVRLFACCVHYKKLIVYTATNDMYQLILTPQDLSHQQVAEDWEQWARAASYLQRSTVDIKESRGVREFFKIDSKDNDPFRSFSLEKMDIYPFDQNIFQNWLQKTEENETSDSKTEKPNKHKTISASKDQN